jgi:hypothetical protein
MVPYGIRTHDAYKPAIRIDRKTEKKINLKKTKKQYYYFLVYCCVSSLGHSSQRMLHHFAVVRIYGILLRELLSRQSANSLDSRTAWKCVIYIAIARYIGYNITSTFAF